MDPLVYITLAISIYVLYLTLKYKYMVCPYETRYLGDINETREPIKVSQIFSSMFQEASPIPGNITINVGGEQIPNI